MADSNAKQSMSKTKGKLSKLLHELSDDKDNPSDEEGNAATSNAKWPWLWEFHSYLDTIEHMLEGWTMVKWWGVHQIQIVILSTNYTVLLGQWSSSLGPFGAGLLGNLSHPCSIQCYPTHIQIIQNIGSYFLHPISLPSLRIIVLLSFPLYFDPSSAFLCLDCY